MTEMEIKCPAAFLRLKCVKLSGGADDRFITFITFIFGVSGTVDEMIIVQFII